MQWAVLDVPGTENEIQLSVFPNPSADEITFSSPKISSVRIFNSTGACVAAITRRNFRDEIVADVRKLPSGIYYYIATNESNAGVHGKVSVLH
jgi:hypothetical protein